MVNIKVQVEGLSVWYRDKQILRDICILIPEKKITAVMGPSGCGKTTFLKSLNRLIEIHEGFKVYGKVLLDGKNIYDPDVDPMDIRARIGMVFQKPNPFPHLSIYDNVVVGLKLRGITDKKYLDRIVRETLEKVGLWDEVKDRLRSSAAKLSGGQQQRLCIARALALNPEVLLLDEPTSHLDFGNQIRILSRIEELSKEGFTIIITSHFPDNAFFISHKVGILNNGSLVSIGHPDDVITEEMLKECHNST